ncbi:MAG: peptidoglycan DD-metalloendopeptidase family protein [Proteobacteria bacterium]|nr:peptidoglycan DD-metalloendopeptidase family protein [Pseudomonadota bacterium]MCP4921919.1 peptidoglycan DD-metalloendopeptidase family protein [Pseudomonadota bacterium]
MTLLLTFFLQNGSYAQDDAHRTLHKSEREERRILTELNDVEQELFEVEREINSLHERADSLEHERMLNEDELLRAQGTLDGEAERVSGLIHALYRINKLGFARVVFSADDPHELRRRTRYLSALLRETEQVVSQFRTRVDVKKGAVKRVDGDRSALAALQAEVRLKEARLRDERARHLALLDGIRADKTMAMQVLRERSQSGMLPLGGSYDEPVTSSTGATFASMAGELKWPITPKSILRGFGRHTDPETGQSTKNLGIDLGAEKHTPVRAVAAGVVQDVTFIPGYGMTAIVDHGDGFKTVYAHLGRANVKKGKRVEKAQVIGTAGETGVTDGLGARVHFEVRRNDTAQDPMRWLGPKPN